MSVLEIVLCCNVAELQRLLEKMSISDQSDRFMEAHLNPSLSPQPRWQEAAFFPWPWTPQCSWPSAQGHRCPGACWGRWGVSEAAVSRTVSAGAWGWGRLASESSRWQWSWDGQGNSRSSEIFSTRSYAPGKYWQKGCKKAMNLLSQGKI